MHIKKLDERDLPMPLLPVFGRYMLKLIYRYGYVPTTGHIAIIMP
jgi:hypothetical protein